MRREDARLARKLVGAMARHAKRIGSTRYTISRGHLDFAPRNLVFQKPNRLAAIDMQRLGRPPVSRGAAQFLVAKDGFAPREQRNLWFGLNRAEAKLFIRHSGLSENEVEKIFPYFVAYMFRQVLMRSRAKPERMAILRERIEACIDDLDKLGERK